MISAAVILAIPALASAAAVVVPVVVDGTVAVTMLVNVSLYLQHKLRCSLVMIIFRLSQWLLLRGGDQLLHHLVRGNLRNPAGGKSLLYRLGNAIPCSWFFTFTFRLEEM